MVAACARGFGHPAPPRPRSGHSCLGLSRACPSTGGRYQNSREIVRGRSFEYCLIIWRGWAVESAPGGSPSIRPA
eukprot:5868042-Pyramimonas_sp.AAC.1